jgi:hypothetical protein
MSSMIRGRGAVLAAVCSGLTLLAGAAAAKPGRAAGPPGPKDKAVLRLDADALGKDYLETNFVKAEKKLQQAIAICERRGSCSERVTAQLHRDLAVVYMAGLGKVDAGKAELKKAVELDPDLELDPDYVTPDIKKAFNALRKGKKRQAEPQKAGLEHTVVTEQAVGTPIPIFASLAGSDSNKIKLFYRGVGKETWASLGMDFSTSGYTAEIPCSADAREGDLAYYIEVRNESEEVVDKSGTKSEPHVVTIKKEISGEAPHLPDADPPARCKNACEGEECGGGGGGGGGEEPKSSGRRRSNWFSVSIQQDLALVGGATDACDIGNQTSGDYSCFRASGSQYHGNPVLGDPADSVNGGLAPSTTRVLIGYDRVLVAGLTLGARFGYVLHGLGPRADGGNNPFPFHVEGRLGYWFGSEAFTTATFRPFIFVNGGAAQVDAQFNVQVTEDTSQPAPPSQPLCPPGATPVVCNPGQQRLAAWRRMGQGFAGGGGGLMVAFTPAFGMFLDVKYMRLFPTPGNAISPELGVALGF